MILTAKEITNASISPVNKLISNYIDFPKQIQPAGFDITAGKIYVIENYSDVPTNESDRFQKVFLGTDYKALPKRTECKKVTQHYSANLKVSYWSLFKDLVYIIQSNEVFHMPNYLSAHVFPRSTLARMGTTFTSAFIDPGYKGVLEFTIRTGCDMIMVEDARFAQVVFHRHKETKPYNGQYQGVGLSSKT
jgi:deoxycytidine triphosphate deaminase